MALVEKDPKGEREPLDIKPDSETLQRLKERSRFCGAARETGPWTRRVVVC